MMLSRLVFNPLHPEVYRLAQDPYGLHIRLCACFAASRSEAAVLYRWEEGPALLVQSEAEPDWTKLDLPEMALRSRPQTKPFDPSFALGQRLGFRLRCRPSRKLKVPDAKHSRQRYLRTDDERLAWLARQGEQRGFRVESVLVIQESWIDTKPIEATADRLGKGSKPNSLPATRFDGVLVVTDPDKLREAVRNGIGPQKAYGFGLLSLARLEE